MKKLILQNLTLALLFIVTSSVAISLGSEGVAPIADAGSSRYAAQDPIVLDGAGSYNPDNTGPLNYTWHQISGPTVVISEVNTATPTISGFIQTDEIQECEFELLVSDVELTSLPDTVKVIIVPGFGQITLELENHPFDPDKPTIIYFGGGDCITGRGSWGGGDAWAKKANIIYATYGPDTVEYEDWRTYYNMGDMIIVYLSSVAPEYAQLIQTIGWSTGGQPAMDVGIRLNRVYKDTRYTINHVTLLDAPCRFLEQSPDVFYSAAELFLTSTVGGEQCWIDNYWGSEDSFENGINNHMLDVWLQNYGHSDVRDWYRDSLTDPLAGNFNGGIVAGAYWSVVGHGKNLQRTQETAHQFNWSSNTGMSLFNETKYPGRFPEPVHLISPVDGAFVDANGAIFSCKESENAVGYQLLFGPDPYRVMDYYIVSDTPSPPNEVITSFPYEQTWWTVQVYDAFGTTIYADPVCVYPEKVEAPETGLIAHWKLDETKGIVAHDSAGISDANLIGDPVWQPYGGMVDGALSFDGIDDYVSIPFILHPRFEPFSLFAWIKGDVSKEYHTIFSHIGVNNLLYVNFEGKLVTSAWASDVRKFIISQEKIIPGQWHHVGLVWDGSIKSIYLDSVEVAQVTVTDEPAGYFYINTGLYIGASSVLQPTGFFSGLIDDVRIYHVALSTEEIAALVQ